MPAEMGKLNAAQIEEYFNLHLPYRVGILLAHYKMTHDRAGRDKAWTGDPAWLNACFVASMVTARLFLNVLGIGKERGGLVSFGDRDDDVTVDDLGGKRVDIATLSAAEHSLILDFLKMADKAAAHFTSPSAHDWSRTPEVIRLVHAYLNTHLYDHAGRTGIAPLEYGD